MTRFWPIAYGAKQPTFQFLSKMVLDHGALLEHRHFTVE